MKNFPENIKFKFPWRTYQEKVLRDLNFHLEDKHLHIVAPPGSGKTVLGLEVMLRINEPTLIITPTIAIKNQWKERFCELFLESVIPDWISTDIKNPKFVTISTYQGIYAFCNSLKEIESDEEEESEQTGYSKDLKVNDLTKLLKKTGTKVFILDEAHHLKNAWWKTLTNLKNSLEPKIIALTATPPFDVSDNEWRRYIQLNGPVDSEISIPELMKEGDLCPHQDLVYFTLPSHQENEKILNFHKKADEIYREISTDDIVLKAIENHPVFLNPDQHLEWIYNNISSYSSCLVYLNFRKIEIPIQHFEIIGDESHYIPEFNFFWLEELLDFYLFSDNEYLKDFEEHRTKLQNQLKRNGFLDNKFVCFSGNENVTKTLSSSISKLQGIKEIVDLEHSVLKEDLRLVILTDYIRKEYLSAETENNFSLDKIGVISIFEKLRRENSQNQKIGVLSGSIVIIPKSALSALENLIQENNLSNLQFSALSYDQNYLIIHPNESIKHNLVQLVTEIFQQGEIQILVGTKSLLGEGWDAPNINSLILASFVSSFVLSNQMRGRAIRISKDFPQKAGNIWHLICYDQSSENGGSDFDILQKRFKTFVGISNDKNPSIENRFERLNLPAIQSKEDLEFANQQTFNFAKNRENLPQKWNSALQSGNILIEEIQVPFGDEKYKEYKLKSLNRTIGNLSGTLVSTFLVFGSEFLGGILRGLSKFQSPQSLSYFISILGFALFFTYGGLTFRTFRQYLKYKNISKNLLKIGKTVMLSLMSEKLIKTSPNELKLVGNQDDKGNSSCHLEGGSNYEKSIFIQTLQETISPIDNPRYLIMQNESYKFPKNKSYFAVPEIFGRNKKSAEYFANQWNENVGNCKLIFTRTTEGRKLLLKLRLQSILKQNKHIEHINKWIK